MCLGVGADLCLGGDVSGLGDGHRVSVAALTPGHPNRAVREQGGLQADEVSVNQADLKWLLTSIVRRAESES